MNIQSPKAPLLFGLRFNIYFPSQVLQVHWCFYHSPLPSLLLENLLSTGCLYSMSVTSLRCYYAPIRHLVCLSVHFLCPSYRAYLATRVFFWDIQEGIFNKEESVY